MREKYLKICSFAKSRNMQIILFVLVSIVYLVCVVFALGISYFLYLPSFIQQFLYIFGSFSSICLYYKTFEKLINKRNIFFENLTFFFLIAFQLLYFVVHFLHHLKYSSIFFHLKYQNLYLNDIHNKRCLKLIYIHHLIIH